MLVFIIAKVGFMLICHEGHIFTIADVWQVVTHGLSLDLSVSFYILILPLLLVALSLWIRIPRWVMPVYAGIIAIALALAFVADASLYPFWGFKLNATCLQYLETPKEAFASVSAGYIALRIAAIAVIALVIYKVYPKHWDISNF